MKKIMLKFALCATVFVQFSMGMEVNELNGILERAWATPLAAKALQDEKKFREETITQIVTLEREIDIALCSDDVENPEAYWKKIKAQIKKDQETTRLLNETLKPLVAGTQVQFSVKTNKISDILDGVYKLIEDSFFDILDHCSSTFSKPFPAGYDYDQKSITMLGGDNKETIWGNSRGTFLKTALMYIWANGKKDAPTGFGKRGTIWFHQSALAHVAPLPAGVQLDPNYSFACPYDLLGTPGLVYFHSGYALGGEPLSVGRPYVPHDCSSWLSAIAEAPRVTTPDILCAWKMKTKGVLSGIPEGWEKGRDARWLLNQTEVVTLKDPQQDLKPGQFYSFRRFNKDVDPTMTQTLGTGGHVAMVLGIQSDGEVVTLGVNRNMPTLEGEGVQNFKLNEPFKLDMVFSIKK